MVVHHAAYVAVSSLASRLGVYFVTNKISKKSHVFHMYIINDPKTVVVVVLDDAADAVAGGRDLLLTITLQCRRLSRQSHHSLHKH